GVEDDRFAARAQPKFRDEIHRNAIQVRARLAHELGTFHAQETQVRFLCKILSVVRALLAAHQRAMQLREMMLASGACDSLLPRRFQYALRHSSGSPPGA